MPISLRPWSAECRVCAEDSIVVAFAKVSGQRIRRSTFGDYLQGSEVAPMRVPVCVKRRARFRFMRGSADTAFSGRCSTKIVCCTFRVWRCGSCCCNLINANMIYSLRRKRRVAELFIRLGIRSDIISTPSRPEEEVVGFITPTRPIESRDPR